MRILVVEDDTALAAQIAQALRTAGFVADVEHDGEAAAFAGCEEAYDAAVLDLGLPHKDGLSVLRDWREAGHHWPVLVLTARNRWSDKVAGFNAGADDYLTKPFMMEEVLLRLRAMLRRSSGSGANLLRAGALEYDVGTGHFMWQGQTLQLTAQEHKILAYFMHHPGQLITRTTLSEHVYARDLDPDSNTIDVLIGRIRRKLGTAGVLVTERGQGFRLNMSEPR
ncbi:response regulator transcription factor [Ottowia sp.]|uniref:response regulator transcription factor n=1 Tax=Ottowia sp. TaxID=1898956 RepID=UPI003A89D775